MTTPPTPAAFDRVPDRGSPRDAWDVANLPAPLAETVCAPHFRRLFMALAATLGQPLTTYTRQRLDAQLAAGRVAAHLAPMLAAEGPPDARALGDGAWGAIAGLLALSRDELEYFAEVDRGELRLGLLFPDQPGQVARRAAHSARQWKLANVRGEAGR